MPNVFVLCTGRCGSLTFARACSHLTNYTAAHESRASVIGHDRLDYPANHIEADNRLAWFLGRLDRKYGKDAFYVHLVRERNACAESFARRHQGGLMVAYRHCLAIDAGYVEPDVIARDLLDTITENIALFLRDKPKVMRIRMEDAADRFGGFMDWIGAEGDTDAAIREWSIKHNASVGVYE